MIIDNINCGQQRWFWLSMVVVLFSEPYCLVISFNIIFAKLADIQP